MGQERRRRVVRQPLLHRAARNWALSGFRGAVLFWRLVERLTPWPSSGLVRVPPGLVIPVLPHDYVAAGFYRGTYERPEFRLITRLLAGRGEMLILDIGANVGAYTSLFSHLAGSAGRVLAFEPAPDTYAVLDNLVMRAPLENVTTLRAAVGRERGTARLFDVGGPTNSGLASMRPTADLPGHDGLEVDVVSLGDLDALDRKEVDLIKIDVEGLEEEVLTGAADLFRNGSVRFAMIEVSPQFGNARFISDFFVGLADRYACLAISEVGRWRRRPVLVRVEASQLSESREQFNLLAVRRDELAGLPWTVR